MTQKEYTAKRSEIVENFIENLSEDEAVRFHNAFCDSRRDEESEIFSNDYDNFNDMMRNVLPWDLAMYIEQGDYRAFDKYFCQNHNSLTSFDSVFDSERSPYCVGDIMHCCDIDELIDLLRDAGVDVLYLDCDLTELQTEYAKSQFKEEWEGLWRNKMPIIQFPNGESYYVNYDEECNTLVTGVISNAGFGLTEKSVEIDIDYDFDLDSNWQTLYETICEKYPELLIENN